MERTSPIYKIRRKMQVLAHKLISDETMSKLYFRIVMKKKLNLKSPQTFNEKLQWLKLYYFPNNSLAIQCADKFAVRDYIKSKGLEDRLVPLLGAWDSAEKIDWNALPQKFVLKCNHGCAYNILCPDKKRFDTKKSIKQLSKWMNEDFGAYNVELHYSKIHPHMITAEEYLGDCITDYKFFCFNGKPQFIYVSSDMIHDRQAQIGFYYLDGTKMPLIRDDYAPMEIEELPPFFETMKQDAEILCKDFPFVRVDFFVANNTYYFAELTFTPSAGMMPFNPPQYDLEWGNLLNITEVQSEGKKQC